VDAAFRALGEISQLMDDATGMVQRGEEMRRFRRQG
jgi:hypothetical protein